MIEDNEVWVNCYYSDKYEVSNQGIIRNKTTNKIIKDRYTPKGYKKISLSTPLGKKTYQVHRVILMSFNPDGYFDKAQGNHKNFIKDDNRLINLEWCSNSDNHLHYRTNIDKAVGIYKLDIEYDEDTLKSFHKIFGHISDVLS